jgi:hypothetical protein
MESDKRWKAATEFPVLINDRQREDMKHAENNKMVKDTTTAHVLDAWITEGGNVETRCSGS